MSWLGSALAGLALVAPGLQEQNRLWWAELEVRGPAGSIELDLGRDGSTEIDAEFVSGEAWERPVPLPLVSPLGAAGLSGASLPEVVFVGEGTVRLRDWSRPQPAEGFARRYRPFLQRPRPVPGQDRARASMGELVALAAFGLLALWLRRSPRGFVLLALLGCVSLFLWASRRADSNGALAVLEVDLVRGQALEIRSARERLELAPEALWLEVSPAEAALRVRHDPRPGGRFLVSSPASPAALLSSMAPATVPELAGANNAWMALDAVWTRSEAGSWSFHGPWGQGRSLPSARGEGELPGWLASGLAPGRGVLIGVAREPKGPFWVRITGWLP